MSVDVVRMAAVSRLFTVTAALETATQDATVAELPEESQALTVSLWSELVRESVLRLRLQAVRPFARTYAPPSIDTATLAPAAAVAERSDVTAVPAMGVIAEAMVAFVAAQALLEKFGGDSLGEVRRNFDAYLAHVAGRMAG